MYCSMNRKWNVFSIQQWHIVYCYFDIEIEPIIVIISFSVFIAYLFCWTSNLYLLMDAAYKDTFSVYYNTRVIQ